MPCLVTAGISREEPAEARAKLLALLRGSEEVTSWGWWPHYFKDLDKGFFCRQMQGFFHWMDDLCWYLFEYCLCLQVQNLDDWRDDTSPARGHLSNLVCLSPIPDLLYWQRNFFPFAHTASCVTVQTPAQNSKFRGFIPWLVTRRIRETSILGPSNCQTYDCWCPRSPESKGKLKLSQIQVHGTMEGLLISFCCLCWHIPPTARMVWNLWHGSQWHKILQWWNVSNDVKKVGNFIILSDRILSSSVRLFPKKVEFSTLQLNVGSSPRLRGSSPCYVQWP